MELELITNRDGTEPASTEIGSYFVANYPLFSVWSPEHIPAVRAALRLENVEGAARTNPPPLGLYLHIPFCRKRCKFCYFRVFTDKNASEVETYLEALAQEIALYAEQPALQNRDFEFVYFGGGTPSFLSAEQLTRLIERINRHWRWDRAREVTFECEPGTLKKSKLRTIKEIGVTRLSLGVEHFDDQVLTLNGRAHKSPEILRAYDWARDVGFDQLNVDLIAGMMGDDEPKWKDTVDRTLALRPDSLTVYQMELPHNTLISQDARRSHRPPPVADWATKRAWADYAFRTFEAAGYVMSSAYTVVRPEGNARFVYRDSLWHGSDLVGTGVASFGFLGGVHYQNDDSWEGYIEALSSQGELPLSRALPVGAYRQLIREMILQLKLGRLDAGYFRDKFKTEITESFHDAFDSLVSEGFANIDGDEVRLTRSGLLRVDALLPRFFEPEFRNVRYT